MTTYRVTKLIGHGICLHSGQLHEDLDGIRPCILGPRPRVSPCPSACGHSVTIPLLRILPPCIIFFWLKRQGPAIDISSKARSSSFSPPTISLASQSQQWAPPTRQLRRAGSGSNSTMNPPSQTPNKQKPLRRSSSPGRMREP